MPRTKRKDYVSKAEKEEIERRTRAIDPAEINALLKEELPCGYVKTKKERGDMVAMPMFHMPMYKRKVLMKSYDAVPIKTNLMPKRWEHIRLPLVDGEVGYEEFDNRILGILGGYRAISLFGNKVYLQLHQSCGMIMEKVMDKTEKLMRFIEGLDSGRYREMSIKEISKDCGVSVDILRGFMTSIAYVNQEYVERVAGETFHNEIEQFRRDLAETRVLLRSLNEDLMKERENAVSAADRLLLKQSGSLVPQILNSITNASESMRKLLGIDRPQKAYLKAAEEYDPIFNKVIERMLIAFAEVKDVTPEELEEIYNIADRERKEMIRQVKDRIKKQGASDADLDSANITDICDFDIIQQEYESRKGIGE